ncbi:hypothetical protein I552_6920 [Mycobacterium xenopi 3993]|nr:hypothetical protein I552_6920 [Mycobacterium xenopi 3993]
MVAAQLSKALTSPAATEALAEFDAVLIGGGRRRDRFWMPLRRRVFR